MTNHDHYYPGWDLPFILPNAMCNALGAAVRVLPSGSTGIPVVAVRPGVTRIAVPNCRCSGMIGAYQDRQREARQARIRGYAD